MQETLFFIRKTTFSNENPFQLLTKNRLNFQRKINEYTLIVQKCQMQVTLFIRKTTFSNENQFQRKLLTKNRFNFQQKIVKFSNSTANPCILPIEIRFRCSWFFSKKPGSIFREFVARIVNHFFFKKRSRTKFNRKWRSHKSEFGVFSISLKFSELI